jgi:LytR cell envelope-related transcriptional attenuator
MHVIESIGPVLGMAAFVGLAVLAFLLFQQSRDIRRVREWAGRAPERAQEAAEAVQTASEAAREAGGEGESLTRRPPTFGERLRARAGGVAERVGSRLRAVDRRLPVDGRYLVALGLVAVAVAAVVTSGFGLVGRDGDGRHRREAPPRPTVAILNGTTVTGLADAVDKKVVKPAGYKAGTVTNAGTSFANTVVMYDSGGRAQAKRLAGAIRPKLGETPVQAMTPDVKAHAKGAPLALALGLDDAGFGGP